LILKRQRDREGGLDAMAAKYARMEEDAREKKRAKKGGKAAKEQEQENEEPPVSSYRRFELFQRVDRELTLQEISDADFEALQAKMFGGKGGAGGSKGKKGRA
jgi:DnaJ family protein C protein 9